MRAIAYRVIVTFCRYFVLPLYATVEVEGLEKMPRQGPLILVSNHLNDGDPGIFSVVLPRPIAFMAKAELFGYPVMKQFMDVFGFPVRRDEADLSALRRAQEILREGRVIGLFPEGRRSGAAARLIEARPGAALIALRTGAAVLPVAITGSQRLGMPGVFFHPLRRDRVHVRIGDPFFLAKPDRLNSEAAARGTETIMARIAALLPAENRGYYGGMNGSEEGTGTPVS